MNKTIVNIFILILIISSITSCTTYRKSIKKPLKEQGEEFIFKALDSTRLNFETVSSKIDFKLEQSKTKNSLNANIRIISDSLIWISISPNIGLEIARLMILKDSVYLINRMNKSYFEGDFSYLNKLFDFNFSYKMIEDLLMGNSFFIYPDSVYKINIDKDSYQLNSPGRGQIKRQNEDDNFVLQKLWVNADNYRMLKILLNDFDSNRKLTVSYDNYESFESFIFPLKQEYELDTKSQNDQNKKGIKISAIFTKLYLNKEIKVSFTIPEKYEKIQ